MAKRAALGAVLIVCCLAAGACGSGATGSPESHGSAAPGTGVFASTGSMALERSSAVSVLLSDGRVLVAGGGVARPLNSAELFDPKSGSFAPTGSMLTPRAFFTATLLQNGLVLVVGGSGLAGSLASAELYDPKSGTFHVQSVWDQGSTNLKESLGKRYQFPSGNDCMGTYWAAYKQEYPIAGPTPPPPPTC